MTSNFNSCTLPARTGLQLPLGIPQIAVLLFWLLASFCASPVFGAGKYEAAGIEDARAAEDFFRGLQKAVANNRRTEVAGLVAYPLNVRINNRSVTLRNQRELLQRYPSVFNQKVRQAVAHQKVSNLSASWRGVMVGQGELWFNQLPKSKRFKITAINN